MMESLALGVLSILLETGCSSRGVADRYKETTFLIAPQSHGPLLHSSLNTLFYAFPSALVGAHGSAEAREPYFQ